MIRRSLPAPETIEEIIALAPAYLRDLLRKEVPRDLRAEAADGIAPRRRHVQTTFLERTAERMKD